jgi:hypothetical protein
MHAMTVFWFRYQVTLKNMNEIFYHSVGAVNSLHTSDWVMDSCYILYY